MLSPEQFSVRLAEVVDLVVSAEHLHEKVEELWCLVVLCSILSIAAPPGS